MRKEIESVKQEKLDEIAAMREEFSNKEMTEQENLATYKEQIKQHSVTICSMEERLNKAQKKSKTLQQENRFGNIYLYLDKIVFVICSKLLDSKICLLYWVKITRFRVLFMKWLVFHITDQTYMLYYV
mgnify:CR=1 FL=1